MYPFDHSTHLFIGFDPRSHAIVAMLDNQQIIHTATTLSLARAFHGDLADTVRRELQVLDAQVGGRNWIYCVPRIRHPRLHRSGGKWLEMMSGIRCFVDSHRQSGMGDYIFQVTRAQKKRVMLRLPDDFPPVAANAYHLAAAMRWQYVAEPESIFN